MAGTGITKEEMEKLLKRYGGSQSTPEKIDTDFFNKNLRAAGEQAVEFGKGMVNVASTALDSFQNLSKSGAGFSNDLIGMTKAAFNSRLNLNEFSDVIKTNAANLAGLGGNVTRGAEAFARLSKEFFDSGASDTLRDLGYTSKDLNEILAIQVGSQKSSFKDTEEGRRRSIQAAADLAKEMDAVAKLTGKSREEQMEEMKRRKVDGQVEAKFRLIAQEKGEDEARKIRSAYEEQRIAAAKRGDEELFKQQFATGTYLTKSAGTNAAILGGQARALEEAASALAAGDIETARQKQAEADAAALKNANDRTILTLSTFGSAAGTAGEASQKFVENTDTMYHSVKKVAEANGLLLNTQQDYAKALKLTLDDIKAAQSGLRRDMGADGKPTGAYRDVSGASRAVVTTQQGMQDARSAAATAAAAATSESLNKLGQLADQYRESKPILKMEESALKGLETGQAVSDTTPSGKKKSDAQIRDEKGGLVGQASQILKDVTDITVTGVTNLFINDKKVGGRQEGSAGMTGKLIEDFGQGTLMMLHGNEGIITEDQLTNLALGMKTEGVAGAINQLKSSLPPPEEKTKSFAESMAESVKNGMKTVGVNPNTGKQQGLSVADISKTVSTTVSSITGGETTTRRIRTKDSKDAEDELQVVKDKYVDERSALAAKFAEMMPEASARERRKAMNESDEGKALNAKYDALMRPLEKRIEDGIKWEVDKKSVAVEEVKKIAEEELNIVKLTNSELAAEASAIKDEQVNLKKQEREEIFKKADELRNIVGTNIKGMSEDAISALLPAGTAMEDFYEDMDGNLRSFTVDSADKLQKILEDEKEYQAAVAEFEGIDKLLPSSLTMPEPDSTLSAMSKDETSITTDTEFGDLAGAMQQVQSKAIDLNAINLPGFGPSIKSAQATVAPAVNTPKEDGSYDKAEAARLKRQGSAAKAEEQQPAKQDKKEATLSDLLTALNTLNSKMGQLLSQNAELSSKQVKAVNKMSQNGFVT